MQRDINFFSVYRNSFRAGSSADKTSIIGIVVLVSCLFVVLLLQAVFLIGGFRMTAESNNIRAYLNKASVSNAKSTVSTDNQKIEALRQYQKTASAQVSAFSSAPTIDSALDAVAKAMPSDVAVTALDYKNSVVTLNCSCTNQLSPAVFVHDLAENSSFSNVTYQGVNLSGSSYTFTVTFSLKEALK